jgi:hypothetical protein
MGGGGGAGEANNNYTTTGGNGGGIIIITATEIITTGSGSSRHITANGQQPANVGNDGAGAGGAGGSILLNVQSWNISSSRKLIISANGGTGGSVGDAAAHGGGGGGGQGAVVFPSTAIPTTNITTTTLNGNGGRNYAGGTYADDGGGSDNQGIMNSSFAILPQRVIGFRAFSAGDHIDLAWQVVNESRLDSYEVQRSSDGNAFSTIGDVRSANAGNYHFSDTHPLPGLNIYRLKLDGEQNGYVFSSVASATQYGISRINVALRPNPVSNHATLQIFAAEPAMADVRLMNMYGSVVLTKQVKISSGENKIMLSGFENFPPGVYQLFVSSGSELASARMTISE